MTTWDTADVEEWAGDLLEELSEDGGSEPGPDWLDDIE